jgi:Pyridoxamine 5'-phosphate oxidase
MPEPVGSDGPFGLGDHVPAQVDVELRERRGRDLDGCFWFETGKHTRKGKNLARDPRCTLSVAAREFDLVVAGEATLVADPATVAELAARWAAEGWPARADDTGVALTAEYSAPSAGPPPWHVFRLVPRTATAVGTVEPGGATRWRF